MPKIIDSNEIAGKDKQKKNLSSDNLLLQTWQLVSVLLMNLFCLVFADN